MPRERNILQKCNYFRFFVVPGSTCYSVKGCIDTKRPCILEILAESTVNAWIGVDRRSGTVPQSSESLSLTSQLTVGSRNDRAENAKELTRLGECII